MPTVLIADPSDARRAMLRSLLEIRDYRVLEATTGEQVLTLIRHQTERMIVLLNDVLTAAQQPIAEVLAVSLDLTAPHVFVVLRPQIAGPASLSWPASLHLAIPFTVDALQAVLTQAASHLTTSS